MALVRSVWWRCHRICRTAKQGWVVGPDPPCVAEVQSLVSWWQDRLLSPGALFTNAVSDSRRLAYGSVLVVREQVANTDDRDAWRFLFARANIAVSQPILCRIVDAM